jgi:extradiol dioxygenase family protein
VNEPKNARQSLIGYTREVGDDNVILASSKKPVVPFHLAFPVSDLAVAREFYGRLLNCSEGRSSEDWIDFNFFGHQLVAHLVQQAPGVVASNHVDKHDVPVPHFGVVLPMDQWRELAAHLAASGITFVIEPGLRFQGQPGEQATMFFLDPFGNALEFKAFENIEQLFAT